MCAAMIPFVGVNYDMVDYLPDEAQSTTAVSIMNDEFAQAVPNANVLVHDVGIAQALALKHKIAEVEGVEGVMWLDDVVDVTVPLEMADASTVETYYRDGAALFQVTVAEGSESTAVPALRALVDEAGPGNAVSGEAADTAQTTASTSKEAGGAALILVPVIILLLVLSTTSWIEPLLFIAAIGVSILIKMGTNIVLGQVSFITFSVSPILQLAVSLDYAIFLLHAFAAERRRTPSVERAMALAMRRSLSTIAASAVTTLFGFAALAFMQFQIGADLGINLVKGIVFSFFTVMVFLPAMRFRCTNSSTRRGIAAHALVQERGQGTLEGARPDSRPRAGARCSRVFGSSHRVHLSEQRARPEPACRADTLMIQDSSANRTPWWRWCRAVTWPPRLRFRATWPRSIM
ncbi:MAG: MMPL family transporter [Eggerthella lenta]